MQSHLYSFLRACAERSGLQPHLRFGHTVHEAHWDEGRQRWHLETSEGPFTANVFVCAVGGLSEPAIPRLPGLEKFQGKTMHSARWDHAYPLAGRKVAVIGTGASAIQFVPEIQPKVGQLVLFQRTPRGSFRAGTAPSARGCGGCTSGCRECSASPGFTFTFRHRVERFNPSEYVSLPRHANPAVENPARREEALHA